MSVGIGEQIIIILYGKKEAAQFNFWEYINGFSPALHLQCTVIFSVESSLQLRQTVRKVV
jgi:hypothetical protein